MTPLVIGSRRYHWIAVFLGSMGFAGAGALMLTVDPAVAPVGWLSILFFGGCAIVAAKQLLDTRPRIVIDDRGILDRTLGVGLIEWTDIEDALVVRTDHAVFVCLELHDTAKYTTRLSPVMQRLVQLNRRLGYTDLNVNLSGLAVDPERVCELILKEVRVRRPE